MLALHGFSFLLAATAGRKPTYLIEIAEFTTTFGSMDAETFYSK
jgi:hypothetical protein